MLDLFGTPTLPGLATHWDVITPAEEQALTAAIDTTTLTPFRFQGWTGKRLTAAFGYTYDFDTNRLAEGDPIPAWLHAVRARLATLANLPAGSLAQALLIRYDAGAGIGWHKDRPIYRDVLGLSLGAPATMRFRRRQGAKFLRATLPLAPRAAYHLAGAARDDWEHSIAEMDHTRWSITFRSLR